MNNWMMGKKMIDRWRQAAKFKTILSKSHFRSELKLTFNAFKALHEHK